MKLFVALLALVALPALAVEKTFTWVAPTTNTDGSALPAAQITGYVLTCGATVVPITGAVTTFKRDFGPGTYTCSLQARANGQTSAPSNSVSFVVPQPTPSPPSGLSVSDAG
jgi:hypothetical protein